MERYSFFDAQQGENGYDRTYSSADLASYFSSFIGNGVYANPAKSLMVQADSGLQIKVLQGKAFINGYFYELSEEPKVIQVARGDNNFGRIDLVVLSLNMPKRLIEVKVLKGSPADAPQAPSYVRSDTRFDLVLAEVNIPAGATALTDSLIKDCRPNNELCGFVSGVVEQIDTSNLFRQYDSEFNSWFDNIKGSLSGDVAGNLSNEIATLKEGLAQEVSDRSEADAGIFNELTTIQEGMKVISSNTTRISNLESRIKMGVDVAPETGTPNTIYLQLL